MMCAAFVGLQKNYKCHSDLIPNSEFDDVQKIGFEGTGVLVFLTLFS